MRRDAWWKRHPVPQAKGMTASPERLSEVSRLAGLLADQVLDAQIMSRPVPDQHIRALLSAAFLLDEYGIQLPSLLQQIVHGAKRGGRLMQDAEHIG